MNIVRAFVDFMEDEGFGTFGSDLFIGVAPYDAEDACWWVIAAGGTPVLRNETGEKLKQYTLNVYYRSNDAADVYETLFDLEQSLNAGDCAELENFDTMDIEALLFPADQDIDAQERSVGLVQVTITIYL